MVYLFSPVIQEDGRKTFYFSANSSGIAESDEKFYSSRGTLAPLNFFSVKGESVFVYGECRVAEILKKYSAETVFTDTADGITNYYCRSYRLPTGIKMGGKYINFHLSVADYGYTVATPLAVGWY